MWGEVLLRKTREVTKPTTTTSLINKATSAIAKLAIKVGQRRIGTSGGGGATEVSSPGGAGTRGKTSYQQTPSPSLLQEYAEPWKLCITLPPSWDTPRNSTSPVHVYGLSSHFDRILVPDLEDVVRTIRIKGHISIHNAVDRLLSALLPFQSSLGILQYLLPVEFGHDERDSVSPGLQIPSNSIGQIALASGQT